MAGVSPSISLSPWMNRLAIIHELQKSSSCTESVPQISLRVRSSSGHGDVRFDLMGAPFTKLNIKRVVKSESGVRREKHKKPDPPCVICDGTGQTNCFMCDGRGRTNFSDHAMLPKGQWPKWCIDCKGSGLSYCTRCLGTGERRGLIGFHVLEEDKTIQRKNGSCQ